MERRRINSDEGEYYVYENGKVVLDKDYYKHGEGRKTLHCAGEIKTSGLTNSGYRTVRVNGENCYVHRLVAMAFCENNNPEDKTTVDHIDGDKLNNDASNLEWVTPKENAQRAVKNGLYNIDSEKRKKQAPKNARKGAIKTRTRTFAIYDKQGNLIDYFDKDRTIEESKNLPHDISRISINGNFYRSGECLIAKFGGIPKKLELRGWMKNPQAKKNKVIQHIDKDGKVIEEYERWIDLPKGISKSKIIYNFNNFVKDDDGSEWFIGLRNK